MIFQCQKEKAIIHWRLTAKSAPSDEGAGAERLRERLIKLLLTSWAPS